MVRFIIYAVGFRILLEMAKWNVKILNKLYDEQKHFRAGLALCLSIAGWIALALYAIQEFDR